MNDAKWEAYQQRLNALHKQYRKRRWRTRLIWLVYFIITTAIIFILIDLPYSIAAAVFNLMLSMVVMFQSIKKYLRVEATQEQLLMADAPVGKIRL